MMARRLRSLRARRDAGDRGAVLVEAAIVVFLLAILVFGMVEMSFGWKNSSVGANSLRAAARVGASAGDDRTADYEMLRAVSTGMSDLTDGTIDRVIIYRSTSVDGEVPASCLTSAAYTARGVSGLCNVYRPTDLAALALSTFDGSGCTGDDIDGMWCPTTRNVSIDSADYVGVYMRYDIGYLTDFLPGSGFSIADHAVNRLEPSA